MKGADSSYAETCRWRTIFMAPPAYYEPRSRFSWMQIKIRSFFDPAKTLQPKALARPAWLLDPPLEKVTFASWPQELDLPIN
jgi:hypothetical protein